VSDKTPSRGDLARRRMFEESYAVDVLAPPRWQRERAGAQESEPTDGEPSTPGPLTRVNPVGPG